MINLLNLVDAIFVINLPERTDRLDRMNKVLASVGLRFEDSQVFLFPAFKMKDAAGFPSPGVHGCFLSHKSVLEQAKQAGYQRVLILEDDVEFTSNTLKLLETLDLSDRNSLPSGFFYLGYEDPNKAASFSNRQTQSLTLEEIPGRVVCAHAYID